MNKLTKALMGTTCLTLAAAAPALAGTINETTDFSNTFGAPTLLPDGTDVVNGSVEWGVDGADYFTFGNLTPGDYTFSLERTGGDWPYASLYLDGNFLTSMSYGNSYTFTVGESGSAATVGISFEGEWALYRASLTSGSNASGVPEPSTFLLGAAGLAGALAWRRKRSA